MKVVISCCNRKNGEIFQYDGQKIHFVARPELAPIDGDRYVHPDDIIPNQAISWRNLVDLQTEVSLIPAYKLYHHLRYEQLFRRFDQQFYIFSAGWGIVKADYKLPNYNITFSYDKNNKPALRRSSDNRFIDFNHLEYNNDGEDILFIGGSKYILTFCKITKGLPNKKIVIYKSKLTEEMEEFNRRDDFHFDEYMDINKAFTNWHYVYAKRKLLNL